MKKIIYKIEGSEHLLQRYSKDAVFVLNKYKEKLDKFKFENGISLFTNGLPVSFYIYKTKTTFVAIISEK